MARTSSKGSLAGKTFLFTGTLTDLTREEAEKIVKRSGGTILSGLTDKLNYLVVGKDAGSKLDKAKKLKTVKIVNEEEFIKMVASGEKASLNTAKKKGRENKSPGIRIDKKKTVQSGNPDHSIKTKELITLVETLISNLDPTPTIVNNEFPLRWESDIFISDYDFDENHLDLDQKIERANGKYLKSVGTAIEIGQNDDGSFEYKDGVFMHETHAWCSKLNTKEDFPSFSLIERKLKNLDDLKKFLSKTFC